MKHIAQISILALCLVFLTALNCNASRRGRARHKAKADIVVVHSEYLHCDDTIAVFTPSKLRGAKGIKTVFVLHGYAGNWHDWSAHMDIQALADETGWRIITPDGFFESWYFNNADKSKMQYRSFFWEEAWPMLDEKFGLDPSRTAITGLSMGGHGAMNIFLDHPERFVAGGSMSGVLVLNSSSNGFKIREILGKQSASECECESAVARLENLSALGSDCGKLVVVSCGTSDDAFRPAALQFAARCQELGIRYRLDLSEGGHDWVYWPYILPYHIAWFDETITENARK